MKLGKRQGRLQFAFFHVRRTITVVIFCSGCDASLVFWSFAHFISKPIVICARSRPYNNRDNYKKTPLKLALKLFLFIIFVVTAQNNHNDCQGQSAR